MFGPHLMLDCQGCPRKVLEDVGFLYEFLDTFPETIGMHKIMPPYVFSYTEGKHPKDWGISGVVIIAESHISVHTFPEKSFVSLDIFSCKPFNYTRALQHLLGLFQPTAFEPRLTMRGRDFPRDQETLKKATAVKKE